MLFVKNQSLYSPSKFFRKTHQLVHQNRHTYSSLSYTIRTLTSTSNYSNTLSLCPDRSTISKSSSISLLSPLQCTTQISYSAILHLPRSNTRTFSTVPNANISLENVPSNLSTYELYIFAANIIASATGKENNIVSLSPSLSSSKLSQSTSSFFTSLTSAFDILALFDHDEAKAMQYAHKLLVQLCEQNYLPALNRLGRWSLYGIYGESQNIRLGLTRLCTVASLNYDQDIKNNSLYTIDEQELIKDSIREACYWYGNAWTKMSDMAAEENILLKNTEMLNNNNNTTTTNSSANSEPKVDRNNSSSSSCQGNGSCGGTGNCSNKNNTSEHSHSHEHSNPGHSCQSKTSKPELTAEQVAEKEKQRAEAAKRVMAEIRSFRKRAIANKVRRTQGLPPLDDNNTVTNILQSSSSNSISEDPRTLPLQTNENRAEKYFLKGALLDHEDCQVALGNLYMRTSTLSNPRIYEAIGWYELAAKVSSAYTYANNSPDKSTTPIPSTNTSTDTTTIPPSMTLQSKQIYNFAENSNTFTSSNPSYTDFLQHHLLPHPDAVYNLGMIYWEGIEGYVQPDPSKALSFFETGVTLQDISSLYFLGVLYINGNAKYKVLPNTRRGLRLIELSASQGHHQAALFLAQFWRTGKPKQNIEPDIRRSKYFLELAGDTYEDTDALAELGDAYYHGINGFTKDLYKSFMYYEKAAKQGHMHAAVCTGSMYYHGMGIPQNFSTAAYFYKLAGERGSPEGWRNLASLHATGQGVVKDMETAKGLLNLANKLEMELLQHQQQLEREEENNSKTCGTTGELVPDQGCAKVGGCGCKSN